MFLHGLYSLMIWENEFLDFNCYEGDKTFQAGQKLRVHKTRRFLPEKGWYTKRECTKQEDTS